MNSKFGFTAFTFVAVCIIYLFLTVMMPFISGLAFDASANISAGATAGNYTASIGGLNYAPLFIYFLPGVIGIVAIVIRLKQPD